MKTNKRILLAATVASLILLTNCRKNISVPNADVESIFGTWQWVQSSGGESGRTITPSTEGHSAAIEFDKNGICFFLTGNQKDKMEFTLTEGHTIYSSGQASLIHYKDIGVFDKKNAPGIQSIQFHGKDTLFLNDECYDCFGHIYVRAK